MTRLRPLPLSVRARLFQHFAALEKAGVPSDRACAMLNLGADWRVRVESFQRLCARGIAPPTAGASSGLFTEFETQLLRAAFAAGSPYATYERLADALATAAAQSAALRARLIMPVTVLVIALGVAPLPQLIQGTLSNAEYQWKVLSPLAVLAVAGALSSHAVRWYTSGAPGPLRATLDDLILFSPLFGGLHLRRNARDFAESLGLLLQAGLPMFDALPVAVNTVANHLVRRDLDTLLPALERGATLAQAVGKLRLANTAQLHQFVHTGEQSGTLAEMLARYARAQSEALALAQAQLMDWLPRIFYGGVALWMVVQLLSPRP